MWNGTISPISKNYNGSTPEHGWDKFDVTIEFVGNYAYITIVFDHRDICFSGEDVPSNGKEYTFEVELEWSETEREFRRKAGKNFAELMSILRERATQPVNQEEIARIVSKTPPGRAERFSIDSLM